AKSFFFFFFSASYSSWIFVIIVRLYGALILESPIATRTTSVNPSLTVLIDLQIFAIYLATASQLVTGRLNEGPTLFSEGGLAHSTLTLLADQRMHRVEVVLTAGIATVNRYRLTAECAYHFDFIECSIFVFFKHELPITTAPNADWAELCVYWKLILRMR